MYLTYPAGITWKRTSSRCWLVTFRDKPEVVVNPVMYANVPLAERPAFLYPAMTALSEAIFGRTECTCTGDIW